VFAQTPTEDYYHDGEVEADGAHDRSLPEVPPLPERLRVVIADDEELVRGFLSEAVADLGHEVVALAGDGPELTERVQATRPDLVITDIRMPRKDGVQTVRDICAKMAIPVLIVTGVPRESIPALCGCIHVILTKPVGREGLQEGIARVMHLFREGYGLSPASGSDEQDAQTPSERRDPMR
jgi:CheY-like chemotaxis protein